MMPELNLPGCWKRSSPEPVKKYCYLNTFTAMVLAKVSKQNAVLLVFTPHIMSTTIKAFRQGRAEMKKRPPGPLNFK